MEEQQNTGGSGGYQYPHAGSNQGGQPNPTGGPQGGKPQPIKPPVIKSPNRFTGNKTFDFYFHHLLLTFTTQSSLFSSKKIERFLIFCAFMTITVIYVAMNINEIKALELVELIGLWLAYGGWNTFQGYRDKKLHADNGGAPPPMSDEIPYDDYDDMPPPGYNDRPPGPDGNVTINF